MKTKIMRTAIRTGISAAVLTAILEASQSARADINDNFSTISGWTVDRTAPAGFASVTAYNGNPALQISIANAQWSNPNQYSPPSAFYDTQGYTKQVNPNTVGSWTLSANLNITSDMLNGSVTTANELWGNTGTGSGVTGYYIAAITSGATSIEQGGASSGVGPELAVWNDVSGAWSYTALAGLSAGFDNLTISYNAATDDMNYYVGGTLEDSQLIDNTSDANGDPDVGDLQQVSIEGYNFDAGSTASQWQNLNAVTGVAAVPEPSTYAMVGIGFLGLFSVNRLRRKSA